MKIKHTFKGMLTGEIQTITADDMVSPTGGYTQRYMDDQGKSYENGRAQELFGDADFWEWQTSERAA